MSSDLPSAPAPSGGTSLPPHPCVFSQRLPLGTLKQHASYSCPHCCFRRRPLAITNGHPTVPPAL